MTRREICRYSEAKRHGFIERDGQEEDVYLAANHYEVRESCTLSLEWFLAAEHRVPHRNCRDAHGWMRACMHDLSENSIADT